MKMDRMVEYLENRGFEAKKHYNTGKRVYEFSITKAGVTVNGFFKYPETADMEVVDKEQRKFLDILMNDWDNEYNKHVEYCKKDIEAATAIYKNILNAKFGSGKHSYCTYNPIPAIKDVIYNGPATVVLWADGTKTVVKCCDQEFYDPEKGLAMAICEKALGGKGVMHRVFKKYAFEEEEYPVKIEIPHLKISLAEAFDVATEHMDKIAKSLRGE